MELSEKHGGPAFQIGYTTLVFERSVFPLQVGTLTVVGFLTWQDSSLRTSYRLKQPYLFHVQKLLIQLRSFGTTNFFTKQLKKTNTSAFSH